MSVQKNYVPRGVVPACLLPFNEDLSIDEANFRRHLRDLADTPGLSAITVNGHSTEVSACTIVVPSMISSMFSMRGKCWSTR